VAKGPEVPGARKVVEALGHEVWSVLGCRAREAGSPIDLGPLSACRWGGIRWPIRADVGGANDEADEDLIGLVSAVQSVRSPALHAPRFRV
jgi:hypothetical protein